MIAVRRPRRLRERVSDALVFTAALALPVAAAGYAVAVITTPDPKTQIRTVVHEYPPACGEVAAAVQGERALAAQLDEASAVVLEESAQLGDVALSADPEAITEQAETLDAAKRDRQQLGLDLATARSVTDATVADCAPERAQ